MRPTLSFHTRGFTLVELMIVITMIMILMGITLFPYNYYMDRSRVEKDGDMLSQEWLLAHTAIRNGMLYDGQSHAHMYLYFHTGSQSIEVFLSTGGLSPQRLYRTIHLESAVEIQSIQGIAGGDPSTLIYHIAPPNGIGRFSTGGVEFTHTGIRLRFGYRGSTIESGRSREILFRPYYSD